MQRNFTPINLLMLSQKTVYYTNCTQTTHYKYHMFIITFLAYIFIDQTTPFALNDRIMFSNYSLMDIQWAFSVVQNNP